MGVTAPVAPIMVPSIMVLFIQEEFFLLLAIL